MARVREFEPEEAVERAMRLFWHKGYAETSVRDLVDYTSVAHAGLYSAFGGKRALFRAALQHYFDTVLTQLLKGLESPNAGRAEVEQLFEMLLGELKAGGWQNGCLMCNTAVEFGDEPGDIQSSVNKNIERMVKAFQGALERARVNGEVRPELDPRATAEFLVSVFVGSAVLVRAKSPHSSIERGVRVALKELD
jgi:TetR/AcrR family transcriptional repressor of nem operon